MWKATFDSQPRPGFSTSLTFEGKTFVEVSVRAIGDEKLSGDPLREVRVMELVGRAMQDKFPCPIAEELIAEVKKTSRRTSQSVDVAGQLHEYADSINIPPQKFVQETLGLSPATAGRWVRAYKESK